MGFWPVALVKNVINVMSFDKMNVLHLHASDMCRFGVESKLFPELTASLSGIKEGHYTQDDIRELVAYGLDRGVRILPEFDMPGHAACFIPMEPRGLEWCNKPNESPIPNWCTLKATNGTVAWDLMPQLALEMAQLFDSEVYHIGGDETRCSGSGSFETMLLDTLAEGGFRTMGWSEVKGAMRNDTIIHAWKGGANNATTLASQGIASVDSNPSRFYRGSGKSTPGVTKAWSDLNKESIPEENRHFLLGGEFAFWTDPYCYINGCECTMTSICGEPLLPTPAPSPPAPSSKNCKWHSDTIIQGDAFETLNVQSKEECCAACLNAEGCAASEFNYLTKTCRLTRVFDAVWRNDGSLACVPLPPVPTPDPTPKPTPTPTPVPSPSPSCECAWHVDTGVHGNDIKKVVVKNRDECCGLCSETQGCLAVVFAPQDGNLCHVKRNVEAVSHPGSMACLPSERVVASLV